mmetsp:Transcript_80864/g.212289  ORF Transcript_80864/g.212289 Transcript_80864/m.212289 type:complete len:305 (+) Transcript_80864:255-1169(+)
MLERARVLGHHLRADGMHEAEEVDLLRVRQLPHLPEPWLGRLSLGFFAQAGHQRHAGRGGRKLGEWWQLKLRSLRCQVGEEFALVLLHLDERLAKEAIRKLMRVGVVATLAVEAHVTRALDVRVVHLLQHLLEQAVLTRCNQAMEDGTRHAKFFPCDGLLEVLDLLHQFNRGVPCLEGPRGRGRREGLGGRRGHLRGDLLRRSLRGGHPGPSLGGGHRAHLGGHGGVPSARPPLLLGPGGHGGAPSGGPLLLGLLPLRREGPVAAVALTAHRCHILRRCRCHYLRARPPVAPLPRESDQRSSNA